MQKLELKKKTEEKKKDLINTYDDLRRQMNIERDKSSLKQYYILKQAWEVGKKIQVRFTKKQLGIDFNLTVSTVKRLLSLDRMNEKTEKLAKKGKISISYVLDVTSRKNNFYQKELIEKHINEGWTTYNLQKLDINNLKNLDNFEDIRMKKIKEEGYTRKSSASMGYDRAINNIILFIHMDLNNFPVEKHPKIKERIIYLHKEIGVYIKNIF